LKKTNIKVLSEENKDNLDRLENEYLWIIDPVDGTKDFINKT
jgi:3'(2'), 5'-bisphosphate nucleotidase